MSQKTSHKTSHKTPSDSRSLPVADTLLAMPSAARIHALEQESQRINALSAAITARADYNAYFRALQTATDAAARNAAFAHVTPETVTMIDDLATTRAQFADTLSRIYLEATDPHSSHATAPYIDAMIRRNTSPHTALDQAKLQHILKLASFGGIITDRFKEALGLCVIFRASTKNKPSVIPLATWQELEKGHLVVTLEDGGKNTDCQLTPCGKAALKRLALTWGRTGAYHPVVVP